jgi:hypothetical protein
LTTDNTGDDATLVLDGSVYVTRNLEFQQSGKKEYTVDLNGQTLFAEGSIFFSSKRVSICGPGCIIAIGDLDFSPNIASREDDFVLLMSITGELSVDPSGQFTGCWPAIPPLTLCLDVISVGQVPTRRA